MTRAGSTRVDIPDEIMDGLAAYASRLTGFRPDAISETTLRAVATRKLAQGHSPATLAQLADGADELLGRELTQAVPVGETYFFRHPEQFERLARELAVRRPKPDGIVRCWSAGCATGEETYSLAACVRGATAASVTVEVVGTDIVDTSLAVARRGVYGRWSTRDSGPLLYPVVTGTADGNVRVLDDVRALVRFTSHNLLLAPLDTGIDVIFCRNVLVYFRAAVAMEVCARLVGALAPDGVIAFGSMDLPEPPRGVIPLGPPSAHIYTRSPAAAARPRPPTPPGPLAHGSQSGRVAPVDPVAMHIAALAYLEVGDPTAAEDTLAELSRLVPSYVPAIVERALLHRRYDQFQRADQLMRSAHRLLEQLPRDHVIVGPHPMSVGDYRRIARSFLDQHGGKRDRNAPPRGGG